VKSDPWSRSGALFLFLLVKTFHVGKLNSFFDFDNYFVVPEVLLDRYIHIPIETAKMARFGFMIGLLASASLGLLLLLQVIASIDLGQSAPRFKANSPILQQASRADDSVFLLGAGKADITG
jgi:hypothetical protein